MATNLAGAQDFRNEQQKFERVAQAYAEKWPDLSQSLELVKINAGFEMFIAAYKDEGLLEVWLKNSGDKKYTLFKAYPFCAHSGTLGPKLKEGDGQTPEGFYEINIFNPLSSFYLSVGLNYPNATDLARNGTKDPGSDIYIHGNCVTVGCIPLTDELIKEVYVLAVEAKNGGQEQIAVYIYPFRMSEGNMKKFSALYPSNAAFWQTLKEGYAYFNRHKTLFNPAKQAAD